MKISIISGSHRHNSQSEKVARHIQRNLEEANIADQAWLYLEQEKALDWPTLPDGWVCRREKTTPEVRYGLFCISGH